MGVPPRVGALHPLMKMREEFRNIFFEMGCDSCLFDLTSDSKKCLLIPLSKRPSGISTPSLFPSNILLVIFKTHSTFLHLPTPPNRHLTQRTWNECVRYIKLATLAVLGIVIHGQKKNHQNLFFELILPPLALKCYTILPIEKVDLSQRGCSASIESFEMRL